MIDERFKKMRQQKLAKKQKRAIQPPWCFEETARHQYATTACETNRGARFDTYE